MPRLIADDAIEGFKQIGLLPRDIIPAVEEKETPIVVNVTVEQDNSKLEQILTTLSSPKDKKLEKWEFTVERDSDGNMSKIIANQLE